jgi:hypothetical protein
MICMPAAALSGGRRRVSSTRPERLSWSCSPSSPSDVARARLAQTGADGAHQSFPAATRFLFEARC